MEPEEEAKFNYVYFGVYFAILVLLTSSSIFTKESLGGSQLFFFLYALGQVTLEIALFIALSLFIPRYFSKLFFAGYIGCTFIALFLHAFDFLMDRILDLSVWSALRIFVFDESLGNFFYLLDASGISLWIWFTFFAFLASLPLIGVLLYKISEFLAQKKPLILNSGHLLQAILCLPLALLFWDFSASRVIHPDAYTAFIKSLPWKFTFLQPENVLLTVPGPLRPPLSEATITAAVEQDTTELTHKPNIYLFVVESLREDSITAEIAPHLYQFKNNSLHFDKAISSGNGTHLSWFSIFHSQFPFHWQQFQKTWKTGSPALNLLKKWGYQIHLYSSAQLAYYGMEELLFGDQKQVLDSTQNFHHVPPATAADTDAEALAKLQRDIAEKPELQHGQVFIIFWDCTHFDYSWPKNWSPKFNPFAQELAYFRAFQPEKRIGLIKNRYHNSVNYMDSLFGRFMEKLPNKEEAIVIFTGDHGEEFFEHGHLFHNSHLTREQMHIPLYMKFGALEPKSLSLGSHMDIFPTILEYLSFKPVQFLEGNSHFSTVKWPYAVTARFNAGRTPYEFSLHNEKHKLIAQFQNRKEIFSATQLQIISLRTYDDLSVNEENVESWVESEFGPALKKLFNYSIHRK